MSIPQETRRPSVCQWHSKIFYGFPVFLFLYVDSFLNLSSKYSWTTLFWFKYSVSWLQLIYRNYFWKNTSLLLLKIFSTLLTNNSFGQTSLNMVTTVLWKLILKCAKINFITNIYITIFFTFPSEMFKYMYQFTNCNIL